MILFFAFTSEAFVVKDNHVRVELISENKTLSNNFVLGVYFQIDPEWHIYWKNPGDSGAAPKFKLSNGSINSVQWPYPERIPVGDFTNFGYSKEVILFLDVVFDKPSPILSLEWLVCKVECIPGFAEIVIDESTVRVHKKIFDKFKSRVPIPDSKVWETQYVEKENGLFQFSLKPKSDKILTEIKNAFVYPENGSVFLSKQPNVSLTNKSLHFSVPYSKNSFIEEEERFVFALHKNDGSVISFSKGVVPKTSTSNYSMALFLAFLGGLLLNLMPCVFPILSLKVFSFVKEGKVKSIRKSSRAYGAGVITTFLIIGGMLMFLRFSGESLGWGFQLQHPWLVYLLSLLFFGVGLNFLGAFEFSSIFPRITSALSSHRWLSGDFGVGILAVLVASPCTAPFMGSALGLTLLLPAWQSLTVFLFLGIGFAVPMVLLAYYPGLIERLPRPGRWMILVRQLFAFPLFATCIWLFWILSHQKGIDAVFLSLGTCLVFALGIWLTNLQYRNTIIKLFGLGLVLLIPFWGAQKINKMKTPDAKQDISLWTDYNESEIAKNLKTYPVFIDFTASWCITCQVNKKTVLETKEIIDLFKKNRVYLVRADWTNYDKNITETLASFRRNSVPLYVFYDRNGSSAKILPELLTKKMIIELFKKGDKK